MPSKSPQQHRLMAACANKRSRKKMKKCPPMDVAREFIIADKAKVSARRKNQ